MLKRCVFLASALTLLLNECSRKPGSKEVVEAMFSAFNRHDSAAIAELYTNDARLTSSDFCSPRKGKDEVRRTYQELFDDFPDIRDEVETYVVQQDKVAVKFTAHSEAHGPMKIEIVTFLSVRDGHIVSDESIFDTVGRPCSK